MICRAAESRLADRSGSTRFAADAMPLSLIFSRPMRSTSSIFSLSRSYAIVTWCSTAAGAESLLRGAADLAERARDVVERLVRRLDADAAQSLQHPVVEERVRIGEAHALHELGRHVEGVRHDVAAPPSSWRRRPRCGARRRSRTSRRPSGSTSFFTDWKLPITTADSSHSQNRSVGLRRPSPTRVASTSSSARCRRGGTAGSCTISQS